MTGQQWLHQGQMKGREAGLVLEWQGHFCHVEFAVVAGGNQELEIKHHLKLVISTDSGDFFNATSHIVVLLFILITL